MEAVLSYTLMLGPEHPAWRGLQRYTLALKGEHVTEIEFSSENHTRGWAERLLRLGLSEASYRVANLCDTCSIAHALAFCLALEQLCEAEVSPRAQALRCCAAELERAAAHLDTSRRILWALGLERRADAIASLGESLSLDMRTLTGSVTKPDFVTPGGVTRELVQAAQDELLIALPKLNRSLYRVIDGLIDNQALLQRTVEVAALPRSAAEQFGVRGPMARASGVGRDTRVEHPYAFYKEIATRAVIQEGGDLYARLVVLLLEGLESLKLAEQILRELPDGSAKPAHDPELKRGTASAVVEAPRGVLRCLVDSNGEKLTRVVIEPPRQLDRLLVRTLLSGALVDNLAAIIASANHCPFCAALAE
jgi:ech hydrogenase subunit E